MAELIPIIEASTGDLDALDRVRGVHARLARALVAGALEREMRMLVGEPPRAELSALIAPEGAGEPQAVYLVGGLAYRLLAGVSPFRATSPAAVAVQQRLERAPSLDRLRPDLSQPVRAIVARALERDPLLRPSLAELIAVLQSEQDRAPSPHGTGSHAPAIDRPAPSAPMSAPVRAPSMSFARAPEDVAPKSSRAIIVAAVATAAAIAVALGLMIAVTMSRPEKLSVDPAAITPSLSRQEERIAESRKEEKRLELERAVAEARTQAEARARQEAEAAERERAKNARERPRRAHARGPDAKETPFEDLAVAEARAAEARALMEARAREEAEAVERARREASEREEAARQEGAERRRAIEVAERQRAALWETRLYAGGAVILAGVLLLAGALAFVAMRKPRVRGLESAPPEGAIARHLLSRSLSEDVDDTHNDRGAFATPPDAPTQPETFFADTVPSSPDGRPDSAQNMVDRRGVDRTMDPIRIAQYECFERLGSGGMGIVYKARHLQLKRLSAVKVLLPGTAALPDAVEMFRREAQLASSINHPNSVTIYDFGEVESMFYLAMELIDGKTLSELLSNGVALPLPRALRIARQIAEALEAAHQGGIIHRDLKPQNVMVVERPNGRDHVKVVDFGIARAVVGRERAEKEHGSPCGTPAYMSPEQANGLVDLDPRSDVFSFGLLLYQMLSGSLPFDRKGATVVQQLLARAALATLPPPLAEQSPELGLPRDVDRVLFEALEPDRMRRSSSPVRIVESLEAVAQA